MPFTKCELDENGNKIYQKGMFGYEGRKPYTNKTMEQFKEECGHGGTNKGVNHKRKKSLQGVTKKVIAASMGKMTAKKLNSLANEIKASGLAEEDGDVSVALAIIYAQVVKAIVDKDTDAARFVRDTAGESPTNKVAVGGSEDFKDDELSNLSKEELMEILEGAEE